MRKRLLYILLFATPQGVTVAEEPKPAPTPTASEVHKFEHAPMLPPSLSTHALCEELGRTEHTGVDDRGGEPEDIAKARAALEKTASDIAKARAALRTETARLEELVRWSNTKAGKQAIGFKTALSEKGQLDSLARTLRGMEGKKAAEMVQHLPRPLAIELLRKLRPQDRAQVLSFLSAQQAADLMTALASTAPVKEGHP